MDCNLDLEKVAKATVMKDGASAAICIGEAVMEAAENATRFFSGSMELDITAFVLERIKLAKKAGTTETDALREKAKVVAGLAPKRRGRPPKADAERKEG